MNIKKAFTLVELMVFFIFVSLVLAASTPIITKRVKNLPIKLHHGKFICYGNRYEYYNSSKLISSGTGCKFTPPKRASLYKIEVIGAGAGGCEYADFGKNNDTRTGGFELATGAYGDGYTDLDDSELVGMLNGAPFIYAIEGTHGGNGKDTEGRTYVGVGSPHVELTGACAGDCWTSKAYECEKTGTRKKTDANGNYVKDEEGNYVYEEYTYTSTCYTTQAEDGMLDYPTCSSCKKYMNELYSISNSLINKRNCSNEDWCYNIATTSFVDPYRTAASGVGKPDSEGLLSDFASWRTAYGRGARGGYGKDFYIDGYIDFCDYSNKETTAACTESSDEYAKVMGGYIYDKATNQKVYTQGIGVRPYLASLFGTYIQKGTSTKKGSCDGFGTQKLKEHPETKIGNSFSSYIHAQDGYDVEHYDALKMWGNRCYTNAERAKGGEGGWLYDTSDIIYGTNGTNLGGTLRKPHDASDYGISGLKYGPWKVLEGTKKDRIPSLKTTTTLNVKWHEVGNGGGAGSYQVAYVATLGDDCVFNVAQGGAAVNKQMSAAQLKSLHEGLATTLSCNNGTLRISAEGGIYDNRTTQMVYSGFDYITSSGAFTNPSQFVSVVSGGSSPFSSTNVFTKYAIGNSSFGAGGDGSKITDKCTQPYGSWHIDRVYYDGIDKSDDKTWLEVPCTDITSSHAQSGSDGAIIISW